MRVFPAATNTANVVPIHSPGHSRACRDADRAADEQIAMLLADNERLLGLLGAKGDRTAGCPCKPANGGSGVCGCILGGLQVIC